MFERPGLLLGVTGTATDPRSIVLPGHFQNQSLVSWLARVGREDIHVDWSAEFLTIFGYRSVVGNQKGYGDQNLSGKSSWNSNWVVVGNIHGDPVIFDLSSAPCRVLFARHGQGRWTPRILAKSIATFESILDVWVNVYYLRFQKDILDGDYEVKASFKEAIAQEMEQILDAEELDTFMFAAVA